MTSRPTHRPRRLRRTPWLRRMVQENRLDTADLVWPVFIVEGSGERQPIAHMPGCIRMSIDVLVQEVKSAVDEGIPAFALFPATPQELKDENGREALNPDNLMCRALKTLKDRVPEAGLIADVALDPYTSHGHDGLLDDSGYVVNDKTCDILAQQAVVLANAGADIVAPSDMMDGRVSAIRHALEDENHPDTLIMSYAVKYASAFYGPFRSGVGSKSALTGDKKTYQMNPGNRMAARREAALDVDEGADMLMIKPGLPYLDIVREVVDTTDLPVLAYHVSGEYAMLKAAAENGWLDYDTCLMEVLTGFKRAGCQGIFTYAAREAAALLSAG